jgi:hypothetical protein
MPIRTGNSSAYWAVTAASTAALGEVNTAHTPTLDTPLPTHPAKGSGGRNDGCGRRFTLALDKMLPISDLRYANRSATCWPCR